MNEERYLVLIKGEDKTAEIDSFNVRGSMALVRYRSSSKEYTYALRDISVIESRGIIIVNNDMVVYRNEIPISNVERVIDFGTKIRLVSVKGISRVYEAASIRLHTNGVATSGAKSVLNYWSQIAQYASISEDRRGNDTFLESQFAEMSFVSEESVLTRYLSGSPLQIDEKSSCDIIFPFKFNLSQNEALNNALRSQLSVIQGPPGTGKTQTILNIIANLVLHNKTVAIVSGNNAAVQNVQDKLDAKGYGFLVAALGNSANRKRFFENPPVVDVVGWHTEIEEKSLRQEIRELNRQIQRLMQVERKKAIVQRELAAYKLEQEHFSAYYNSQNLDMTYKIPFFLLTPDRILSFLSDMHITEQKTHRVTLCKRLSLLFRYGFVALQTARPAGKDILVHLQYLYYELKVDQLERELSHLELQLQEENYQALLTRHQQLSEQWFRHKLYERYHNAQRMAFSVGHYKRSFGEFIKQYPILLSTTYSLRNCVPDNFMFDYVIVDESSQVDLLTGALALSCAKRAIVVGDTKQLPQIIDMQIENKITGLHSQKETPYDYFCHNLLSSLLALYGESVPTVMLREHYRCHPKIIEFCNQKYYDGQLIPFTSEHEGDNPLLIYRTAEGNHMSRLSHGKKGRFNQRELDVIEHEVLVNLRGAVERHADIGFTTPYRKQVEKAAGQLDHAIEVDTIHKYQGREKPTMILSTVLDSSVAGKKGLQFVNDPHMINVAVSRAQDTFILVTDHALFRDSANEIGDLLRYMEYNTLDDNIVESQIVSVFDLLYKDYADKLKAFKSRVKKRSQYDSENIISTLLSEILNDMRYSGLEFREQIFIRNLFHNLDALDTPVQQYVRNGASVDFVVYHKTDKSPVVAIEVDGFTYHENNPRQLERDRIKDEIFKKYGLPLLRLPTTGSEEERRIREKLDEVLKEDRS